MLVLIAFFLTTAFAQTEWKEFAFPEGNFSVLFPGTPQKQTGAERNLHESGAKTNDESYGLAYADFPASTNWANAINEERDTVVKHFGGKIVDEQRTSIEGHPGKFIRFAAPNAIGELAIYFVGNRIYVLHALAPRSDQRPENFSHFLNSFRLLSEPKS